MTDIERTDRLVVLAMAAGASKERRRIRRAIAPHVAKYKRVRVYQGGFVITDAFRDMAAAIDAATRAPRKARR